PATPSAFQNLVPEAVKVQVRPGFRRVKSPCRTEAGGQLVPHFDAEDARVVVEHGSVFLESAGGVVQGDAAAVGMEQSADPLSGDDFPVEGGAEDVAPGPVA